MFFILGLALWSSVIFLLYALRPSSSLHVEISSITRREKIICLGAVTILIAVCVAPMAWNPHWTGELHRHHNQYQFLADAFLKGQLNLDKAVDPRLLAMENPYDPKARESMDFNADDTWVWDHAFYKGKLYVYFGAVPALILFAPYQLIVGKPLAAYHATQIFAGLFILGLFALFWLLAKKFFPRMSFGVYLMSSVALSLVSIAYCTEAPALYCTASSSGLCMEVWSIYFFARAAWAEDSRRKFFAEIFLGAMLGALAFGCKPTVALANFLVLPLLPRLLSRDDAKKIFLVLCVPYLLTAAALMTYNFLRFDNPFEFGQAYQLTVADQHAYGKFSERFNLSAQVDGLLQNFFGVENNLRGDKKPAGTLRYIIFWLPIFFLTKNLRGALIKNKLVGIVLALIFTPILTTMFQIHWTPFLLERYRLEIYWLLALMTFLAIGFLSESRKNFFNFGVCLLSVLTIFQCVDLFLVPNDLNFTAVCPDLRTKIFKALTLGF